MTRKHYVRVMRPAFRKALIEVDAISLEEAHRAAIARAATLPEKEWEDISEDADQPLIVEGVSVEGDDELEKLDDPSDLLFRHDRAYALLIADMETVQGEVLLLSSIELLGHLELADVASDWVEQLTALRAEHGTEFFIDLKARIRSRTTLRGLLEDFRKERPDPPIANGDDEEDQA